MGCVLGTESGGDRRRSVARRRKSGEPATSAVNAVEVRVRKQATERQRTRRTGDVSANVTTSEQRKPKLSDSFLANQQQGGWPPWLLAAAGDAIRDWTPRRANSFERLAKVGLTETLTLVFFFNSLC